MDISLNALALIVLISIAAISVCMAFFEYFRPKTREEYPGHERSIFVIVVATTFNIILNVIFWGSFGFIALIDWIANNVH